MNPLLRLLIGLAIAIIILLALALVIPRGESKVPFDCFDPTERERVREISLAAIDKGLDAAIAHLYSVWQKDPDHEQPQRARVGVTNAINAHARARKFALAWSPPTCPPEKKGEGGGENSP